MSEKVKSLFLVNHTRNEVHRYDPSTTLMNAIRETHWISDRDLDIDQDIRMTAENLETLLDAGHLYLDEERDISEARQQVQQTLDVVMEFVRTHEKTEEPYPELYDWLMDNNMEIVNAHFSAHSHLCNTLCNGRDYRAKTQQQQNNNLTFMYSGTDGIIYDFKTPDEAIQFIKTLPKSILPYSVRWDTKPREPLCIG
jgi:hypothetical protein